MSAAPYTVRPVKAWTKPDHAAVAAHCVPSGEGWSLSVVAYRIIRPDGATWRPSLPAFNPDSEGYAAAVVMASRLNAPCYATLEAIAAENMAAPRPCPDLAEWVEDMRCGLLSDRRELREATAVEVRNLYCSSLPIGAQGTYQPEGAATAVRVTTLDHAVTYAGKGRFDCTAWEGVEVRFSPIPGYGVVPVDAVAWDAARI